MTAERKQTQIEQLSERAWSEVQKLAGRFGGGPERTPIATFGKELGIIRVQFAPLWSNAGLRRFGDGFEIVINTESPGVGHKAGQVLEMEPEAFSRLGSPLRFTTAHEVAHLVFLKVAGDVKQDVFVKNVEAVENACNILARILLVPAPTLMKETNARILDVGNVRGLLDAFAVSPEVFIRRMHLSDLRAGFAGTDGLLALAERNGPALEVRTCHIFGAGRALERFERALPGQDGNRRRHTSLSGSYRQAGWKLEGRPLKELGIGIDVDSLISGKKPGAVNLDVPLHPGEKRVIPCELRFVCLGDEPPTFLVSIRVSGSDVDMGRETFLPIEEAAEYTIKRRADA